MGAEAGQQLGGILHRKELERRSGSGVFAWGIGNSLGEAPRLAQQQSPAGKVDVLFSPMKSPAKVIDAAPSQILVWLSYQSDSGRLLSLPEHMVITSRGGTSHSSLKRCHYALICRSEQDITLAAEDLTIDASRARNLASLNPLGASQVTSVVKYLPAESEAMEKPYRVTFRAQLHGPGFVRLLNPVVLDKELTSLYQELCVSSSVAQWRKLALVIRGRALQKFSCQRPQSELFGLAIS